MRPRLAPLVLLLAAACSHPPGCPSQPTGADLVTLRLADGAQVSSTPTTQAQPPPADEVGLGSLSNDGQTLVGPGPSPWRLDGAAGRQLGVTQSVAIVLGNDEQLRGVRLTDGRPVWNARLDHRLVTRTAQVRGDVVLAAGTSADAPASPLQPQVVALDGATGHLLWSSSPKASGLVNELAVVGPTIVVPVSSTATSGHATLVALDLSSGAERWTRTLPRRGVRTVRSNVGTVSAVNEDVALGCA